MKTKQDQIQLPRKPDIVKFCKWPAPLPSFLLPSASPHKSQHSPALKTLHLSSHRSVCKNNIITFHHTHISIFQNSTLNSLQLVLKFEGTANHEYYWLGFWSDDARKIVPSQVYFFCFAFFLFYCRYSPLNRVFHQQRKCLTAPKNARLPTSVWRLSLARGAASSWISASATDTSADSQTQRLELLLPKVCFSIFLRCTTKCPQFQTTNRVVVFAGLFYVARHDLWKSLHQHTSSCYHTIVISKSDLKFLGFSLEQACMRNLNTLHNR